MRLQVYKIIKRLVSDEVNKARIEPPDCEKMVNYFEDLWRDTPSCVPKKILENTEPVKPFTPVN
ncbi:hypothetical protein PGB90_002468 [Kerria lacca]